MARRSASIFLIRARFPVPSTIMQVRKLQIGHPTCSHSAGFRPRIDEHMPALTGRVILTMASSLPMDTRTSAGELQAVLQEVLDLELQAVRGEQGTDAPGIRQEPEPGRVDDDALHVGPVDVEHPAGVDRKACNTF